MEKKFRLISIFFIVGCFIYYGGRFGYYYMKFNNEEFCSTGKTCFSTSVNNGKEIRLRRLYKIAKNWGNEPKEIKREYDKMIDIINQFKK